MVETNNLGKSSETERDSEIYINDAVSTDVPKDFIEMCHEAKELHSEYKRIEKLLGAVKDNIKIKAKDLGIMSFKDDITKILISDVEKQYLDETPTIEYLKKNGLEKYIHTKEYFDDNEIVMGITNHEINREDLLPFFKSEKSTRITIK